MQAPLISVCIPVYNGEKYIQECLEKIYAQTYQNIEVLISVDKSTDNTINICEEMKRSNTTIFKQSTRLGWVKNCNFLIERAAGEYFSIIPHDDYVPTDYFESLLNGFTTYPRAINCYPVINIIDEEQTIVQPSIVGSLEQRVYTVIERHMNAVSFRGLIKRDLSNDLLYLRTDIPGNVMVDTLWVLQHAIAGELHCIDVPYYKRYHDRNEHRIWTIDLQERIKIWSKQCSIMYNIAANYVNDIKQLYIACMNRMWKNKFGYITFDPFKTLKSAPFAQQLREIFEQGTKKRAVVMGAGIQGCCAALLLHKLDYNVTLIDKASDIMTKASMNHEGKIHLGFVYSNDKSLVTGKKMMLGALYFAYYIEYLLGIKIDWNSLKSQKFIYLVPHDSLVSADDIEAYFYALEEYYQQLLIEHPFLSYLGERPSKLFKHCDIPPTFDQTFFGHCYETEEVAINQTQLKEYIKAALINNGIRMLFNYTITEITGGGNPCVVLENRSQKSAKYVERYDYVVNCLWENKTMMDQQVGLNANQSQNLRFKFGIISDPIPGFETIPSITIVNGPYGDYVNFTKHGYLYFSWYPASMHAMLVNKPAPKEWGTICTNSQIIKQQIAEHLEKFRKLFGLEFNFISPKLIGGIIVATGEQDIGNITSNLHKRNEYPIQHIDNYYSISTGKFTLAPYNTALLTEMLIN